MSIKYAILGLLSWRPMTGYDLKKIFSDSPIYYWSGSNNQIYRTLVDLHENGLVTREVQVQENYPARKIYTITDKGLLRLKRWAQTSPQPPELRHSFLVQLAWTNQLDADELDTLLEEYEEEMRVQLLICRTQGARNNNAPDRTARETYIWKMIQRNWEDFYEKELDWVRELRKGLKEEEQK